MNHYKLLSLAGMTLAGTLVANTPVQALTFSLNEASSGSGVFSYDIELAFGESRVNGQPLILTNLGGVTAVNSTNNPVLQYSNDFTSGNDSINFSVLTPVTASASSQTFTNVITLTSDNPTGDITYSAFFIPAPGEPGAVNSTTQGPVVPVPFDVSPNTGILMILGIGGTRE